MSRSYKRFPGFADREGGTAKRYIKRCANRKVRKTYVVGNGGSYKKHFEQWDIEDYNFRFYSKNDVKKDIEEWPGRPGNMRKAYKYWMK